MTIEGRLQADIKKYLKGKGCYVLKTRPDAMGGIPKGCPDIFFFKEGFWGAIEVKASPKAAYKTLQKETLDKLDGWSWARRVDPTDWLAMKVELDSLL